MKLKQLLLEIKYNKGTWIDPNGKIHEMNDTIHAEYALENFRKDLNNEWSNEQLNDEALKYDEIISYLLEIGYVRTADEFDGNLYFEANENLNNKVKNTLKSIINDNPDIKKILAYFTTSRKTKEAKEFNREQFLNFLQ